MNCNVEIADYVLMMFALWVNKKLKSFQHFCIVPNICAKFKENLT